MSIKPASATFIKAGSTRPRGNRPPSIYISATSIPTKAIVDSESLGFAMTKGYRSKLQLLSPLQRAIYLINSVDKNENFARLQFEGHLLLRSLADDTVDTEKIWIRD